ncbi:hypothetical protein K5E_11160 [Enterococcus thailandicus]|uniref:hypothetical protein n=1 Tax=Enterococcus thailandicus TaxID=417368 RepID=UPI00244D7E4E|nr:hypothetical protein [Enterococcus thailandicus]GMC02586.1 hypothetical protein K4E_00960 [Enterococcus thailandicus]GMC08977.1 hypothetical protein K5E_11160 [Enterococcus thailandicus]
MEATKEKLTQDDYLKMVLSDNGIPNQYVKDPAKYDDNFKPEYVFVRDYSNTDKILKEEPFRAKNQLQLIDELNKVAQSYDYSTILDKQKISDVVSTFFSDLYDEIDRNKVYVGKNTQFEDGVNYHINIAELLKKGTFKSYLDNEFNGDLENMYYTPNVFKQYAKAKTKENVTILNCLWADVDEDDLTAEELEIRIATKGLPAPSFIIHSGHGFHIIWKLRPFLILKKDTKYFRKKWTRIMNYIKEDLNSDGNAMTEEKYLRLPYTINNKRSSKSVCMSSIVKYEPENTYNIYDFYVEQEEEHKNYWAEVYGKNGKKNKTKTETIVKEKTTNNVQEWSLTKNRVNALLEWLKMRNFNIEGKRNAFLRIMQMGYQNIYEINKLLNPSLEDYELDAIVKNYEEQRALGNYYIMPKKNKIISKLGITAEEAENLNTFKSDEYYTTSKFDKYSKTMLNCLIKVAKYQYLKNFRGKTKRTLIGSIANSKQAVSTLEKKATKENIEKEFRRFELNYKKIENLMLEMNQRKYLEELIELKNSLKDGLTQKELLTLIKKHRVGR